MVEAEKYEKDAEYDASTGTFNKYWGWSYLAILDEKIINNTYVYFKKHMKSKKSYIFLYHN